jgi:glucokinase
MTGPTLARTAIGVDVGGTNIRAAVVTREGHIDRRCTVPTPLGSTEDLFEALDEAVAEVIDDRVGAIGCGIPSRIDKNAGSVVGSVNIPLTGVHFRDRMQVRWNLPCAIDNDANVAAIAEWKVGAGRGTTEMAMLTLGTGVGGGLILAGEPYNGATGAAAELGHMIVEYGGRRCHGACHGRGHLEAYCSGHAATLLAQEALGDEADSRELLRLAGLADDTALSVLHEIGSRLGAAIGTLANMFNVQCVVIGGGFGAAAWSYLIEPARQVAAREALEPGRGILRIVPSELGSDGGLIGAGFIGYGVLETAPVAARA